MPNYHLRICHALFFLLCALFVNACAYYQEKNPPDPSTIVTAQVSWQKVSREFFQTRCDTCHGQGGAGIDTSQYQSVFSSMSKIQQQISRQRMPPDSALTAYESKLLTVWIQNGMPYQATGASQ